jgi:O-antigen biosynthesis protein
VGEIFKARKPERQLRFTGERLTFDSGGQSVYEHLHRYFFAREFCRGRDVLDAASGEGFGSAYLAQTARSVVGVDICEEAIAHASKSYRADNLRFAAGDATRLTCPDASFDVVVSFETIEHFDDQRSFLKEIRRVLRPQGVLIVSTPNRDVYSPANGPVNPFHVRELTREEFVKALRAEFDFCAFFGQRPLTGTLLVAEDDHEGSPRFATFEKRGEAHFESSQGLARPLYFIAVASKNLPVPAFSSVYIETGDVDAPIRFRSLAEERRQAADKFEANLAAAEKVASRLSEERDFLARQLSRTYRRPFRPVRQYVGHRLLRSFSALSAPFSEARAERFARSAQDRNPTRFDAYLVPPTAETRLGASSQLAAPERPLTAAEAASVRLPTSLEPKASVIIPCYGNPRLTLECLKSIADHPPETPFEMIVADNASGDPGVKLLRHVSGLRLEINEANLGFLRSCNRAAGLAKGEYLFFLNNDTLVKEGWLEPLVEVFRAFPDAGLVGSKLLFPDGSLQEAGGIIWRDGSAWNYGRSDDPEKPEYNYIREADYISGCSILVPAALRRELGGFDEHFAPGYCEDSDLAFRIRAAGKKAYYCPFSAIVHLEGLTHGTDLDSGVKAYQVTNTKKFRERWRDTLTREHYPPGVDLMHARDRSRDRKIALIVDHHVPHPDQDAGSRTIAAMIECLQYAEYVVKFWPDNLNYDRDYARLLQKKGIEVLYGRLSFDEWVKENGKSLSLALLSRPTVAQRYIDDLRAHSEARIVYYGHDLHFRRMVMEAERAGDPLLAAEAAGFGQIERSIWRRVDVVLYPAEEETALARSGSPRAATVIAYAYDDFGVERQAPKNREIVFVAGFANPPNVDAAIWLANEVLPLIWREAPDATLLLVGANPTEPVRALASKRVEVTGHVSEEELRARYARARLAMVPLRIGAGVKSNVVESLRDGLPLVTTSVGAQGLPGIEGAVRIADDADGLAQATVKLLLDDALWKEMSLRQIDYARKHFSRSAFRRAFLEAIGVARSGN